MNGEPITFHALDRITGDTYKFTSPTEALEFAKKQGFDVFVDVEDFDRLKAALVQAMIEWGDVSGALFVIKQVGLEEAVGLAPERVDYSHGTKAITDIATPDAHNTEAIGLFSDNPKPIFGSKIEKKRGKK